MCLDIDNSLQFIYTRFMVYKLISPILKVEQFSVFCVWLSQGYKEYSERLSYITLNNLTRKTIFMLENR